MPYSAGICGTPDGTSYHWVRGLSQKELAAILGVDESTVRHWEQGGTRPSEENAARIKELLRDLALACMGL